MVDIQQYEPIGDTTPLNNQELSVIYLPDYNKAAGLVAFERFFVGYPEHLEETEDKSVKILRFRCVVYLGAISNKSGGFDYLMDLNNCNYSIPCGRLCEAINGYAKPINTEPSIIIDRVAEIIKTILNSPDHYNITNARKGFNKEIKVIDFLQKALNDLNFQDDTYPNTEKLNVIIPKFNVIRYADLSESFEHSTAMLKNSFFKPEQLYISHKIPKIGTVMLSNIRFDQDKKIFKYRTNIAIDSNGKVKNNFMCLDIVAPLNNPIFNTITCIEILDFKKSSDLFGYRNIKQLMINKFFNIYKIKKKFKCSKDGIYRDIVEIYHPELKKNIKFTASDVKIYTLNIDNISKGLQPKKDRKIDIESNVYISPKVSKVYNIPRKSVAKVKFIDYSNKAEFNSRQTGKKVSTLSNCYAQLLVEGSNKDVICKIKDLKKI